MGAIAPPCGVTVPVLEKVMLFGPLSTKPPELFCAVKIFVPATAVDCAPGCIN